MTVNVDTTPAAFVDIDGVEKPGGSAPLEDFADQELKRRDQGLSALRSITRLDHPYAKWAQLAVEAANNGQWGKARTLWGNRVCAF